MGRSDVTLVSNKPYESNSFIHQLLKDIRVLDQMISEGRLDNDIQRIGAEQEVNLIDKYYRPYPIITKVLKELDDEHFTYEHAQFNGEINIDPIPLEAGCLYALENNLNDYIAKLNHHVHKHDGKILLAGILPTIRRSDLVKKNLTPLGRFHALDNFLSELRGEPFEFRIEGTDLLIDRQESSMFESCNTSFQIHLQIPANQFVAKYNWAQAIAGPILSCSTNSPILLGKRLWRETRIALFQQSIDTRSTHNQSQNKEPRVSFGTKWIKHPLDIYREDIARHRVILNWKVNKKTKTQGVPKLDALAIHNGTIYRWNRPCYGITNNIPHLRIENRYLPAGPTVLDQVANAALWIGLMKGMPKEAYNIDDQLDFDEVKTNFIKAARMGLGAQFKWLDGKQKPAKALIIDSLLPIAYSGLIKAGLTKKETTHYLNVIKQRVILEKTGSQWLLNSFSQLKKSGSSDDASVVATAGILRRQKENLPVHQWDDITDHEIEEKHLRYHTVGQIMSRDIFSVEPKDSIEYACSIMDWRHIHHILVINETGELKGLITAGLLLHHITSNEDVGSRLVENIMIKEVITANSHTSIKHAIELMQKQKIGSLPVVEGKAVIGFISTKDILQVASYLLKN